MELKSFSYLEVTQINRKLILTKLPAGILVNISYASVRGKDDEPGAVQRLLNPKRIESIKDFTLEGGDYPGAIILNWVSVQNSLQKQDKKISFANVSRSAQIIDGQHRVAGLKSAINELKDIAKLEIPVAIYENLTTKECADIFLAINTEQKTVPPSLVFDLYGIASESVIDPAAVRARDIAIYLNETEDSPFHDQIKFPGAAKRKGGIALSTAITSIKPLVEEKGRFEQISIFELEIQKRIIMNFMIAIREKYEKNWDRKENVFLYASGFAGAMEFLHLKVIPYCSSKSSFKIETIQDVLNFTSDNLIFQSEVSGMAGTSAQKYVYEKLVNIFNPITEPTKRIEI
ncbi:MAG: DGQHR domain-containing protein [Nostocales cyanobacterium LE14-WE4]|jgi:DNA sulfur modification protein DndB|nr:DGQHR domain-containing protein [Anabaena sp. 49633_E8]MCE2701920.1 DGQHR domain-containing protein [Anabaena sp. 49633_E8]MDJ0500266.1 DGQHR domain-containing protein [Nostocales cyanobacterium LE14-WE4]